MLASGPVAITVLPDALLVDGRGFAKPDPAAGELAALLRLQLIGEFTLLEPLTNDEWHAFLMLLARTPADARVAGGLTQSWQESGSAAIKLTEIDYADFLRERAGRGAAASWDRILATLKEVKDESGGFAPSTGMASRLDMAKDADQLAQFAERLQAHGRASGDDSLPQGKSLLEMMHGLANYAAERQPPPRWRPNRPLAPMPQPVSHHGCEHSDGDWSHVSDGGMQHRAPDVGEGRPAEVQG